MLLSLCPLRPTLAGLLAVVVTAVLLLASSGGVAAQTATVFAEGFGPGFLAMDNAGSIFVSALYDNTLLRLNSSTLQLISRISIGAGANYLQEPLGIAVVGTSLYTVDLNTNHLARFSTNGTLIAVYDLASQGIAYPFGIAASADGTSLYLVDTGANPVHQLTLNGTLLRTFNTSAYLPNQFDNAQTIGVDASSGNVYVGCYEVDPATYYLSTAEIFVFTPAGALLRIINFTSPDPDSQAIPVGVAIAANGTVLFVTDGDLGRVVKLTTNGTVLWNVSSSFGSLLSAPYGVLVDPALHFVLVGDVFNARIDKLDYNTGALLATYSTSNTTLWSPTAVAVFGSTVYVTGASMHSVALVAQNGSQIGTQYLSSAADHVPVSIANDASGFTYVAVLSETDGTSTVYKLSPAGVIVQYFNTSSPPLAAYNSYNMAVAPNGDLFVSDQGNARIVRFAANGIQLQTINVTAARFFPTGLALLPNGQLVAADTANSRVWIFAANGSVVTSFNLTTAWTPRGVAVGTSTSNVTQIFVSDSTNQQIVVFSTAGRVLRTLTSANTPILSVAGLALSTAVIYMWRTEDRVGCWCSATPSTPSPPCWATRSSLVCAASRSRCTASTAPCMHWCRRPARRSTRASCSCRLVAAHPPHSSQRSAGRMPARTWALSACWSAWLVTACSGCWWSLAHTMWALHRSS